MNQRDHTKADAVLYAEIFGLLISLTILTVVLSYVNVGEALAVPEFGRAANIVAGLIVAMVKSALVLWFFMHMNHESRLNRSIFVFAISLFLLAVLAFSSDFVFLGTYAQHAARAAMGM